MTMKKSGLKGLRTGKQILSNYQTIIELIMLNFMCFKCVYYCQRRIHDEVVAVEALFSPYVF